ncbi:unnamed protein product [Darwinula stevensoni]|uniref:TAFH domain-containing protein n=1 Tax=Darwinula stevensoni TaxID=69355 RepID=A0A7R9A6U6_9CRUS|nr:unnamed protein product [Darwinula stevensoni]CAG0890388.1 unnamed protein product [Darwinula stevensoni]
MASEKFIEDALMKQVNESDVNAIVGSLESQLSSSSVATQAVANHNGSTVISNVRPPNNIILSGTPISSSNVATGEAPSSRPHLTGSPNSMIASHVSSLSSATNAIRPNQVQILNMPSQAVRASVRPVLPVSTTATAASKGQSINAPAVVIGPQQVGNRPSAPGATQLPAPALQALQQGSQGHFLLRTENGQLQLIRVTPGSAIGPASSPATAAAAPNPNAPTGPGTPYRLQTVRPAVVNSIATPIGTSVSPAGHVSTISTVLTTIAPPGSNTIHAQSISPQMTPETAKMKCKNFLSTLLRLANEQPENVACNVRNLIQGLIDAKVGAEEFTQKLQRELNSSPQPCLVPFLKRSLPYLRYSLATKELEISGLNPPPLSSVSTVPAGVGVAPVPQLQITRPSATVPPQIRMVSPSIIQQPGMTQPRVASPVRVQTSVGKTGSASAVPSAPLVNGVALTVTPQIQPPRPSGPAKPPGKDKGEKKGTGAFSSSGMRDEDDINDVAAMGGVNLLEESQRILGSTEFIGTQLRSCKDEIFFDSDTLQKHIRNLVREKGLEEPGSDIVAMVSHATQEHLKNLVEKLAFIAQHRLDIIRMDSAHEQSSDVKGQIRFLELVEKAEHERHKEQEREMLLRAAKSRSKAEDPEHAKLKAKAKEMQRAELEELRQKEANLTALQAIGPRKKPKLDTASVPNPGPQLPMRPRLKRVTMRDLVFLLEQERNSVRSSDLYKLLLK